MIMRGQEYTDGPSFHQMQMHPISQRISSYLKSFNLEDFFNNFIFSLKTNHKQFKNFIFRIQLLLLIYLNEINLNTHTDIKSIHFQFQLLLISYLTMDPLQPQPILCKAAVAYAAKQPMKIQKVWVAPPKQGQIRIKVISNALCHTDVYRLDGCDPEGGFPCILGHEATGIVESIGKGVTRVRVGDVVIPCYTPQCQERNCIFCRSNQTNLCPKIRSTQGNGFMPDGTSRFTTEDGKTVIYHFMGCSTFAEYTVIAQISAAKINPKADLNKVCMIGCGVSTGWGAVMNNTNLRPGTTVAVWGLGAVGLSVIQAAKIRGAKRIYAIDINQKKFEAAKKFGADICYQPTNQKDGKAFLLQNQKWGIDYTFDCTGNVAIMRQALQASHRGWGQSCVIGVAEAGRQISTRSFQLVTGRKWLGTAFGGWKSVQDVPKLVNKAVLGEWPIQEYVTHELDGLDKVNQAVDILHGGDCLRAVVKINTPPVTTEQKIKITNSASFFGGKLYTVSHWSESVDGFMNFMIYLPDIDINDQRGYPYPVLYCLGGLTANHENFAMKSGFGKYANKHRIAVVFPDTSPRNTNIVGVSDDWQYGQSASYYINATTQKYKQHFQMFTYINEQLPRVASSYFPVSRQNKSITGFSMGGHGALISALRTGQYKSVSAFAPISNPFRCQRWGIKGYKQFFNDWENEGKQYDATELIRGGNFKKTPLFIDVGSHDQFNNLIMTENLISALDQRNYQFKYEFRANYNHSFYYVSSFIEDHIDFHSKYLNYQNI